MQESKVIVSQQFSSFFWRHNHQGKHDEGCGNSSRRLSQPLSCRQMFVHFDRKKPAPSNEVGQPSKNTVSDIQGSISSTFYLQLFRTKVFCTAFLWLQFGFLIFWHKNIGAKAAGKMLVKLTQVNFIT